MTGIRWRRHRDICEARLGRPLRWATLDRQTGRPGLWFVGATVTAIEHGLCWKVYLDRNDRLSGWTNPIYCDEDVDFLYGER